MTGNLIRLLSCIPTRIDVSISLTKREILNGEIKSPTILAGLDDLCMGKTDLTSRVILLVHHNSG